MQPRRAHLHAFTLLEIMMVVAIIGLIMAMGVPAIMRMQSREPLIKAVNGVMEMCSQARALAILQGRTTALVFHPQTGEVQISGAGPAKPGEDAGGGPTAKLPKPLHFGSSVAIEMLDVNLLEYKDADAARVRFFPDGTSDEMTLVLHSSDQWRKISLEVTTALASVEVIR